MNMDASARANPSVRGPMQEGVVATRLSPAELSPITLRRMHAYWHSKLQDGRLPGRRDIDPLEFPWALGLVCLLDVQRRPLTFRYRLDGTTIAERYGADLTGRSTDAVRPDFHATLLHKHFAEVVESGRPTAYRINLRFREQARSYIRLALPLAGDGQTIDMIMTVSDCVDPGLADDSEGDQLFR